MGEGLVDSIERIGIVIFDEYIYGSFEIGLSVKHAEVGYFFGIDLLGFFLSQFFTEKTYLIEWIGLF